MPRGISVGRGCLRVRFFDKRCTLKTGRTLWGRGPPSPSLGSIDSLGRADLDFRVYIFRCVVGVSLARIGMPDNVQNRGWLNKVRGWRGVSSA